MRSGRSSERSKIGNVLRRSLLVLLFHLFAAGAAQQLVVNGVSIAQFSNTLVPGTSYVAAEPFARAIGATYRYSSSEQMLSFELAGRFAALQVGGAAEGARLQEGVPYVPVKEVARQLGGEVDYLAEDKTVVVVFPRARLRSVQPPDPWGSYERFVLRFNAPVAVEERFEPSLDTVRFRFARTDLARKQNFSGERFSDAALLPGSDYADFTLTLSRDSTYEMYAVPDGVGTKVVVDIFSAEEVEAADEPGAPPVIVLDSSPNPALVPLAQSLRRALEERGAQVQRTQGGVSARMAAGIGAPLFVSLTNAPLEAGQFGLYYLAGDAASLSAVIRQNAARARTNVNESADELSVPQRVLQSLTPDLALGEAYAQRVSKRLEAQGWQAVSVEGAPLYLLSGAAGRGVLLELPANLTSTPELSEPLADALIGLLEQP